MAQDNKKEDKNEGTKRNDEENALHRTMAEDNVKKNINENEEDNLLPRKGQWMIKPCDWYDDEYKGCSTLRARFYQHFVHGEMLDCAQWKLDYENCKKWEKYNDDAAYDALLASEKEHRLQRLKPHYTNDVWTKRDKPPENWNAPLPEWMERRNKGSLLEQKQLARQSGQVDTSMSLPLCVIM